MKYLIGGEDVCFQIHKKLHCGYILLCPLFLFNQQHDKWIVVTTIQYPTPALEKLANIDGWHLVVGCR